MSPVMRAWRAVERAPRSAWVFGAGVLAIVVGGAILRLYHLGHESLWLDELGVATVALRPFGSLLEGVRGHAAAAPLDYIGVHWTIALLGHGAAATRAWSWLCGVAGIGAVMWLAWEVFSSRSVAIAAGVLLALSPFHIVYSQEVRFYALSVLVGTIALASGVRAIRSNSSLAWTLFAGAITACLYTHYFLVVVPLSLGAALVVVAGADVLRERSRARFWLRRGAAFAGSLVVAALLFLPWFFFAVAPQATHQFGFPTPNPFDLAGYDQAFLALFAPGPPGTVPGVEATVLARGIELLAILGLIVSKPIERPGVLALGVLAVVLVPFVFAVDARSGYFFNPRQIILAIVPLFVLAAAGAAWLVAAATRMLAPAAASRVPASMSAWAVFGLAAVLLLDPSLTSLYGDGQTKEDWRRVADDITRGRCDDGRVFVNLGPGYSYGLGFLNPELLPVVLDVEGGVRIDDPMAILDNIRRQGLRPTDWVVLRPSFASGEQVTNVIRWLGSFGWRSDFNYHLAFIRPPVTCAN